MCPTKIEYKEKTHLKLLKFAFLFCNWNPQSLFETENYNFAFSNLSKP